MRTVLLLCLCVSALQGQQIRNIQSFGTSHSSVRWVFDSDLPCYQVKYGTTSGVYNFSSYSFCNSDKKASVVIGGLASATTYYFRITVRPNPEDDIGICQTEECGSPELILTTLPQPAVHPELPAPPLQWKPQLPDTSGYLIVPMRQGGKNGTECVAATDVPQASVLMNDDIETILNAIPYGTVLEFPQGIQCIVPGQRNSGYALPVKPVDPSVASVDSPEHKWIVLRTQGEGSADFPPFGARTGASFQGKMAKFVATTPSYWVEAGQTGKGRPQLFTAELGGQHHFWFENLEFTTTNDAEFLPPKDTTDPPPFSALFGISATFPERVPAAVSYVVLDRVFLHGQGHPSRYTRGLTLGGRYQAMIGCSLDDLDYWQIAVLPQQAPVLNATATTLNIPPAQFSRNAKELPIGTDTVATATISASADYIGSYLLQLGPDNGTLKVFYAGKGGFATIACTNCLASQVDEVRVADNGFMYCSGSIANGTFSTPDCALGIWQTTRYGYGWGTIGLELMDGGTGPYYLANNFFGAVGMGIYVDAGGNAYDSTNKISYVDNSNDDMVFEHNHVMWREDHRITSEKSNGYHYPVRNLIETKRSRRWLLRGNLLQNFWSYQNDGSALLFAAAAVPYQITNKVSGILDQTVTSNIIRHGAAGIQTMGVHPYYSAGEQSANYLIENNLMYDLAARHKYSDGDPSLYTGSLGGGARDVTFRHNTIGLTYGDMPSLLYADTSGSVMEGLSYTNNVVYFSVGGTGGGIWINEGSSYAKFPRLPAIDRSSYKTMLDTAYLQGLGRPAYSFTNNIIIGAKTYRDSGSDEKDMTQIQIDTLKDQFPDGNIFPSGDTLSDREGVVGFVNPGKWNYALSPASDYAMNARFSARDGAAQGVDYLLLNQHLGMVTNIAPVRVIQSSAWFQYTAPDENKCVVDTSPDGRSWTRTQDAGGDTDRKVAIPLGSDPFYQYRILCYYQQINDGMKYQDYAGDQITDGVFQSQGPLRRR